MATKVPKLFLKQLQTIALSPSFLYNLFGYFFHLYTYQKLLKIIKLYDIKINI